MINIDVFYNSDNRVVGFEAKGHGIGSDRAETFDLVCCAVSILTISTVNGITDYLKVTPQELAVDDGWLRIVLPVQKDGSIAIGNRSIEDQMEALLVSLVMGLEQVAEDYNKFVKIRKRRWTS